jgi:hypothetical protein
VQRFDSAKKKSVDDKCQAEAPKCFWCFIISASADGLKLKRPAYFHLSRCQSISVSFIETRWCAFNRFCFGNVKHVILGRRIGRELRELACESVRRCFEAERALSRPFLLDGDY